MIPEKDWPMHKAMQRYGGSFIKKLAELLELADGVEYGTLEDAFPMCFYEYRKMAEKEKTKPMGD